MLLPNQLTLLKGIPEASFQEMLDRLPLRKFPKGFLLYDETEHSDEMFAVLRGKVELVRREEGRGIAPVGICGEGQIFGEASLLCGLPRDHGAIAQEESVLLELPSDWIREASRRFPTFRERIQGFYRERLLLPQLQRSHIFSGALEDDILTIAALFETSALEANGIFAAQGERNDRIAVVKRGELEEHRRQGGATRLLGHYGPGSVLGELDVILGMPRDSTLKARTPAELMILDPNHVPEVIQEYPAVMERIRQLLCARSDHLRHSLEEAAQSILNSLPDLSRYFLSRGLWTEELYVIGGLKTRHGEIRVRLIHLSAQSVTLRIEETSPVFPDPDSEAMWFGVTHSHPRYRVLEGNFPMALTFQAQDRNDFIFGINATDQMESSLSALIVFLTHAKLKSLMAPQYVALGLCILADLVLEDGTALKQLRLESLGWVQGRLLCSHRVSQGLGGRLTLWRGKDKMLVCDVITSGQGGGLLECEFEIQDLNQYQQLKHVIQIFRDEEFGQRGEVTTPPDPGQTIEKKYLSTQAFLLDALGFEQADRMSFTYNRRVPLGAVVSVVISVQEGSFEDKMSFFAQVDAYDTGMITVSSSNLHYDMKAFLEKLTQRVYDRASLKIFEQRREELLDQRPAKPPLGKMMPNYSGPEEASPALADVPKLVTQPSIRVTPTPPSHQPPPSTKELHQISSAPSGNSWVSGAVSVPRAPTPRRTGGSPDIRTATTQPSQGVTAAHLRHTVSGTLRVRLAPLWCYFVMAASVLTIMICAYVFSSERSIAPTPKIHFQSALR